MKRLITLLLLVAFTTASLPVNAFGPTPGQLEYYNNGYSPPYSQYGSFLPTPQQNQYNGYDSYNQYNDYNSYNQNGGSFGSTPQQGWGNTNPDGSFYVPQSQCNHSGATNTYVINRWYKEYSDNRHIEYKEYEMSCSYCHTVLDHYTQDTYEEHRLNNYNQCSRCEYNAGCNHQWTSKQTAKYWYEVYDGYYHSEVYIEEEVCNNCGDVLGSQQKSKIWSHQYQNGRCWTCGYIQQSSSQPQYTPPGVNQPEYIEQEPEEEYVEEAVYVEPPQKNTMVLPYQKALQEGRAYAVTSDGWHINKRNYAPGTALGYEDKYYCSINSIYAPLYLPADEVYEQKGNYLYRVSTGERVSASPSILKICDARISELKSTLKGLSDASSRVEQYKQVKKGQIPLASIVEQNRSYIATSNQSHSKVSEVQSKLQQLGYTSQEYITGKIDTDTLNNIAYFQRTNGILSTGWLDNETYNAIMSYSTNNNYTGSSNNTNMNTNVNTSTFTITTLCNGMHVPKGIIPVQVVGNEYITGIGVLVYDKNGFLCKQTVTGNVLNWDMRLADTGTYEITVYSNNILGGGEEQFITIQVVDNSTLFGVRKAYMLGIWDAVVNNVKGISEFFSHPAESILSIPTVASYLVKSIVPGTVENLEMGYVVLDVLADIEDNTHEENARYAGRVAGEFVIALLVTKGIDKGVQMIKASAKSGKFGATISDVANGKYNPKVALASLSNSINTLPNFKNARIARSKIVDYALNINHPVGGNKAKVFSSALGYNQSNADDLVRQIYDKLSDSEAILDTLDQYGQRYTVDMMITGVNGKTANVRTGWIIKTNSDIPELITLFVKN